jgi:hypothetical protein
MAGGTYFSGAAAGDWAGYSISGSGDIDNDGFDDLIIGAPFADPDGGDNAGATYVVFGSSGGFGLDVDLSSLDGTTGFRIGGEATGDLSGLAVSGAGDINKDGFDDLIVGAPFTDAAYVVFGTEDFAAEFDLASLDGTNGFRIAGVPGDQVGSPVSGVGDINGDGIADLIVGAPLTGPGRTGAAYVVYGSTSGFSADVDLASLDGANGFRIAGAAPGDRAGSSVAAAGDVNGDGIADLIVGAPEADANGQADSGAAYVIYGSTSGFGADLDLSGLDGTNGFRIAGVAAQDFAGRSVSEAGDINGDGIDDLLVGAFGANPGGVDDAGAAYVVFGSTAGFSADLDLAGLDGTNGFRLPGAVEDGYVGWSASAAGDINGDGIDDLLVGAGGAESVYLVFGSTAGFAADLDLAGLDGTAGYRIIGAAPGDLVGQAVSAAGDVDGDGVDDLIIGAYGADSSTGMAALIRGGARNLDRLDTAYGGQDGTISLATLCFAAGTLIRTPDGDRPVEALRVGDRVETRDHGPQPIGWIGRTVRSAAELEANPKHCPVRIPVGALGHKIPSRDLRVSRQHRLLIEGKKALRRFNKPAVLVAAKDLIGWRGIELCPPKAVTYHHIALDPYAMLIANGTPAESFWPGPQALKALGAAERARLAAACPGLPVGRPALAA